MKQIGVIILIIFCGINPLIAQDKYIDKAQAALDEGDYIKALKQVEKILEKKSYPYKTQALIIKSKALFYLSDDEDYVAEFPKTVDEALKAALKAKRKKKDSTFIETQAEYFAQLAEKSVQKADLYLKEGKLNKAESIYKNVFGLSGNLKAKLALVKINWQQKDTLMGIIILNELISEQENAFLNHNEEEIFKPHVPEESFRLMVKYLISKNYGDSALPYAKLWREIYPKTEENEKLLVESFFAFASNNPPGELLLEKFDEVQALVPLNKEFLRKKNSLYIYLLNHYAKQGIKPLVDTTVYKLVSEKIRDAKTFGAVYAEADQMYFADSLQIIYNLIEYNSRFDRGELLSFLIPYYFESPFTNNTLKALAGRERLNHLSAKFFENKQAGALVALVIYANQNYSKEKWFTAFLNEVNSKVLADYKSYNETWSAFQIIDELNRGKKANPTKDVAFKYLIMKLSDENLFSKGFAAVKRINEYHSKPKYADSLIRYLSIGDFKANYYGSRLRVDTIEGKLVSEFDWKGDLRTCLPGKVPNSVQEKVVQRINYFRRNSGSPDYVFLDAEKTKKCQYAALGISANNKATHSLVPGMKCWSDLGQDAAKFANISFGPTTVIAVTVIMADKGIESVGNRRWLLYPPAMAMGHGSTNNATVLWTIDDAGFNDSNKYKKDFVAWPGPNYTPSIFNFDQWSFSMYADFTNAEVEVKKGNQKLELKQYKPEAGYGMPTLVWSLIGFKPEKGKDTELTVTIKGVKVNGKIQTISYPVRFFDVDEVL